jgi:hypothetical protein
MVLLFISAYKLNKVLKCLEGSKEDFSNILLYHVRSIDHNIPAGRVFEIVNYWQILLVNPPLQESG